MAKFYIESGQLRTIIEDRYAIRAAAKALSLASKLKLDRTLTINERGFVQDRPHQQRYAGDIVLETGTLLALISEHELA